MKLSTVAETVDSNSKIYGSEVDRGDLSQIFDKIVCPPVVKHTAVGDMAETMLEHHLEQLEQEYKARIKEVREENAKTLVTLEDKQRRETQEFRYM